MHDRNQAQNRDHEIEMLYAAVNALEQRISALERDLGVTEPDKGVVEDAEPLPAEGGHVE